MSVKTPTTGSFSKIKTLDAPEHSNKMCYRDNIYILIAIALDEAVMLVAVHFSMKTIVTSCDQRS